MVATNEVPAPMAVRTSPEQFALAFADILAQATWALDHIADLSEQSDVLAAIALHGLAVNLADIMAGLHGGHPAQVKAASRKAAAAYRQRIRQVFGRDPSFVEGAAVEEVRVALKAEMATRKKEAIDRAAAEVALAVFDDATPVA